MHRHLQVYYFFLNQLIKNPMYQVTFLDRLYLLVQGCYNESVHVNTVTNNRLAREILIHLTSWLASTRITGQYTNSIVVVTQSSLCLVVNQFEQRP